jgi:uncharacterized membrane protein
MILHFNLLAIFRFNFWFVINYLIVWGQISIVYNFTFIAGNEIKDYDNILIITVEVVVFRDNELTYNLACFFSANGLLKFFYEPLP